MQKYVALGPLRAAHPGDEVNEHIWYAAPEADDLLASKDRDLADAQHMLILANNSAAAFQRVAEQRQGEIERLRRAVEWCLTNGAKRATVLDVSANEYVDGIRDAGCDCCSSTLEVPAEFADILKPTTGASNG